MRNDRLDRQFRLLQLLAGGGKRLRDLAGELHVSKKTVQRDLSVLSRFHPITSIQTEDGEILWRHEGGGPSGSPINFTPDELFALHFSRGLLKPLRGTPLHDAIQTAFTKVSNAIAARSSELTRSLERGVAVSAFGQKDYSKSKQVVDRITHALNHHFTIKLNHTSPYKKATDHIVDPYKLWLMDNGLYLVGWQHKNREYRLFALERIHRIEVSKTRFEPREDFDFEKMRGSAFRLLWGEPQSVKIRFAPDQEWYVTERMWHPSQKITREEDGSVVLEMSVADLWEVKRWLIGWGASAEVLEPKKLTDLILAEAQGIEARSKETACRTNSDLPSERD